MTSSTDPGNGPAAGKLVSALHRRGKRSSLLRTQQLPGLLSVVEFGRPTKMSWDLQWPWVVGTYFPRAE